MKRRIWMMLAIAVFAGMNLQAQIQTIENNGAYLELDDVLPDEEPAVILLYTAWEQPSINLREEIANWAGNYPDLAIIQVDCVGHSSAVYQQFDPGKIPALLVFDNKGERTGSVFETVYDLEQFLKNEDLLD